MKTMLYTDIFAVFFGLLASGVVFASEPQMGNTIQITVGDVRFTARMEGNPTALAFLDMLPLTLDMSELNGNEKLYRFPTALPSKASNPGRIHNGDIMLYGSSTLVVFYKSFSTPYSYTRIGRIENTDALENALGPGSITVTFERM